MAILAQGFWHEQSLFSVFGIESNGKNCGMCKSLSNWFVKLGGMGFLIIGLGCSDRHRFSHTTHGPWCTFGMQSAWNVPWWKGLSQIKPKKIIVMALIWNTINFKLIGSISI